MDAFIAFTNKLTVKVEKFFDKLDAAITSYLRGE